MNFFEWLSSQPDWYEMTLVAACVLAFILSSLRVGKAISDLTHQRFKGRGIIVEDERRRATDKKP